MTPPESSVGQFASVNTASTADRTQPDTIFEQEFYDRDLRHDRYLDSIIEQTLDELGHSDDIMALAEIDFFKKRDIPDTDYSLPYNRAKEWATVTDIDLAVVDLENHVIGAYEVKPNPQESEKAWEQLEDFRDHVQELNDEYDMDWRVTGHVVNENHLRGNTEILTATVKEFTIREALREAEKKRSSEFLKTIFSEALKMSRFSGTGKKFF
ncbi:MAG: hypothetical protein ABEK04_04270 [Candidatus Nanohalobium sp.]